jgi:hypothetical protein
VDHVDATDDSSKVLASRRAKVTPAS